MILKSSERANATSLANHLTNANDNERVAILASRDLVRGDDVHRALAEMDAISKGTNCTRHLHHAMMNPAQALSEDQWAQAWAAYEQEFGLEDQPFIEVEHHKEGRTHRHRVYDRITEQLKAVEFSYSKMRNEKVARILEHEFGHDMTVGKHNKAVMARLREDGLNQVADWMQHGKAHEQERPVAAKDHADHQIEKRTGLSKAEAEQTIRQCWNASDSGKSLKTALEQEGLMLARGNRRDFVVVDSAGAPHSLGRRVGEKAKVVKQRMADLAPDTLPDVAQARELQLELSHQHEQAVAEREAAQEAAKQITPAELPDAQQAPDAPLQADTAATDKRKKKQAIKEQLAEKNRQLETLDAGQRRQQAIDRQKQRQAERKRNAARAADLKADLEQREQEGILTRTRKVVSQKLEKVADWMRGLVKRKPQQAQAKEPEAQKQAVDDAKKSKQSQQQRPPEHERKSNKLKRQIIDLEAITREREEREKREGKDKSKEQQKEQDQGHGLERTRGDTGDRGGGDDDPFGW